MRVDLKLTEPYDGFLFLAESRRCPPLLGSHHHDELELNLVIRGQVTYIVDGRRHLLRQRSLLWFFPEQEHQLVDRSDDAAYFVAVFTPGLIRRAAQGPAYRGLTRRRADDLWRSNLVPDSFDLLRRLMVSLTEDGLDPDLLNRQAGYGTDPGFRFAHGDPARLNAGLQYLLLSCWRHHQGGQRGDGAVELHPAVRQALGVLDRADDELPLSALATACGVSPAHLSRIFHREVGVPLTRYRTTLRLGRFWERLRGPSGRTVLAAALAAGFGSYAQFHRAFRTAYGVGPRTFLAAPPRRAGEPI